MKLRSVDEVAAELGISKQFIYREIALGHLPCVQLGRRRLISDEDLTRYVAGRRSGGEVSEAPAARALR